MSMMMESEHEAIYAKLGGGITFQLSQRWHAKTA
jgi:hypothetical protein